MIGAILGNRYKILREIGAGGMAWVYLAQDLTEQIQVAVKVLYPHYSQDISYVQRFIREAQLATQIASDHIVRILNYGSDRDVHYLVMEHIEGQDLSAVLEKRGRLSWQETLEIVAQVTLALEAANSHGIVHRDIKPQNIMITSEGQVKVLDFGIARARALPSLTQSGFLGSPYYISPEQAMGENVDVRSDIYSLGIAMYEMLSGKLPFDASSPWSIISQHIANEPPKLNIQDIDAPPFVESLLTRMLAKDPADRYQTPGELLAAIESAMRGRVTPKSLSKQTPAHSDRAHRLLLSSLYQRAVEAEQAEEWPRAVNLFYQVVKVDPQYQDASQRLVRAGLQARLAALYSAAQAAWQEQRWREAIDVLREIVTGDPNYRDAADMLSQASIALAEAHQQENMARLYREGQECLESKDWPQALDCLSQVYEASPAYKDVARLYAEAKRQTRWSRSFLGKLQQKLRPQ